MQTHHQITELSAPRCRDCTFHSSKISSNVIKMRKKQILLLKIGVVVWVCVIYAFFLHKPAATSTQKSHDITEQLDKLEEELNKQSQFYSVLLNKLRTMHQQQQNLGDEAVLQDPIVESPLLDGPVLPVLLIACNRDAAVRRSLDLLLKYRPSQERFPIVVSQDCGHRPTREAIESYGEKVTLIQHPDLSDIEVPLKERKFKGYFLIARHYRWALNQMFQKFEYEAVIIVEDDLDIAPDFYEYFSATYPVLQADPTLWCVSAWNDNGKADLVDVKNGTGLLYRTDFFPGLGWMLTKELWEELGPKWPRSYWDDWVRAPEQRSDRACIRPEISRTRTFGKKGVSNGLFYEKHLKQIYLNDAYTSFTKMNLTYLMKDHYDLVFEKQVQASQVVTINDVKGDRLAKGGFYRLIYHTKDNFKKLAKSLGLMDDFKAGVPRTGYKGTITFFYRGLRIFLSPGNNWKGYNPSWS